MKIIKLVILNCVCSFLVIGLFFFLYEKKQQKTAFENSYVASNEDVLMLPEYNSTVSKESQSLYYYYNQMNSSERELYLKLLSAIQNEEELLVTSEEQTKIQEIFNYIMLDHPEIYYINGYGLSTNGLSQSFFKAQYTINSDERQIYEAQITHFITGCISEAKQYSSDIDKALSVFEYIVENTIYSEEAPLNQTVCSVACSHASVCTGYAKMYELILQNLGIYSTLATGTASGDPHIWNVVKLDDNWFYIDLSFGDMKRTEYLDINYDYFMIDSDDLLKTHSIKEDSILLPQVSKKNSWYMQNGYMINDYPEVETVLDKQRGRKIYYFKFADENLYNKFFEEYIKDDVLFTRFNRKKYGYYQNDNLYTVKVVLTEG